MTGDRSSGHRDRVSIAEVEGTGSDRNRALCNPVPRSGELTLAEVLLALRETREEREVRIRKLFDFFDISRSGYLDHVEVEKGFRALAIPFEYKYAKDLLDVCDANHDGRVDFEEFRKYMDDKELELYRIFQEIDVKHNGCILPEELRDALLRSEKRTSPNSKEENAGFQFRKGFPTPLHLCWSCYGAHLLCLSCFGGPMLRNWGVGGLFIKREPRPQASRLAV